MAPLQWPSKQSLWHFPFLALLWNGFFYLIPRRHSVEGGSSRLMVLPPYEMRFMEGQRHLLESATFIPADEVEISITLEGVMSSF